MGAATVGPELVGKVAVLRREPKEIVEDGGA